MKRSALFLTVGAAAIFSIGSTALAVDITQPPSAFIITTDGFFTGPDEWSDVLPAVRLGGESLVYTATDPGLEALYLMYDLPTSTEPVPLGATAGPVHFHNGGATFEVFFTCPSSISVLKDGIPFDVSDPDPAGGEDSVEGACGFGTSPDSAVPHNMFELEVLFDGSDTSLRGHSHGQYSPDPSHWGAGLPTDPGQTEEPRCELPDDPDCDANNDPTGGAEPTTVPCPGPDPGQRDDGIRISFGEEVSNACVTVVRGSGGVTLITGIPLPGEPIPCDPDPRTQGYWHRQCLGVPASDGGIDPERNGRGPAAPTESGFVPDLMNCAVATLEGLGISGLTTCEGMDADPPSDKCEKALKQLTALILNVCSDKLQESCDIDVAAEGCTSTTVGQLLEELAVLIQNGECNQAADCAGAVNEGTALSGP